jgi:hypothetical protein
METNQTAVTICSILWLVYFIKFELIWYLLTIVFFHQSDVKHTIVCNTLIIFLEFYNKRRTIIKKDSDTARSFYNLNQYESLAQSSQFKQHIVLITNIFSLTLTIGKSVPKKNRRANFKNLITQLLKKMTWCRISWMENLEVYWLILSSS